MTGVNKVILIGNLGQDPETRSTQAGNMVANFSVATSSNWRDKETGENKEKTEWHRVVAFGKLAEICGQYLHKGSKVYIEGSLQTGEWEKDGQKHYKTEIIAREMNMLDSKQDYEQGAKADHKSLNAPGGDDFDDDIPF